MRVKKARPAAIAATVAGVVALFIAAYVLLARSGAFQLERDQLIARYADSESGFVQVRGIDVHYKDEGQGVPVLLLHGSFGSLRTWDGVVDALEDEFRLIRLDQPPTALSGPIPASAGDLWLEDFIDLFLDALGIERAVLVGTSSGGIIAYRFAAKYPERTTALVIANSPSAVVDNSAIATPRAVATMSLLGSRVLHHRPKLYWRWFLEWLYSDSSKVSEALVQQYYDMGRKTRSLPPNERMYARVSDNDEVTRILGGVRAPTLLLWGLVDPVLPEPMAHQIQRKLSSAPTTLVRLQTTGHYPPVESPERVADEIGKFLESLPREQLQSGEAGRH